MTLRLRHILLGMAIAAGSATGQDWRTDWDQSQKEAREKKTSILVLFTVLEACEGCRSLDQELASDGARWTHELVRVRLDFRGPGSCPKPLSIMGAKARLSGYPTIYLCDEDGWPFAGLQGFDPTSGRADLAKLQSKLEGRGRPSQLRQGGEVGLRKLLAWYRSEHLPLGETIACEALWPFAKADERGLWAGLLIAAKIAADDERGAAELLEAAKTADPESKRGWLAAAKSAAANVQLRRGDLTAAGVGFEEIIAFTTLDSTLRSEAEMSLGYIYRKLSAPCLSRAHYEAGASAAEAAKSPDALAIAEHARRQVDRLGECPPKGCGCAQKRLR